MSSILVDSLYFFRNNYKIFGLYIAVYLISWNLLEIILEEFVLVGMGDSKNISLLMLLNLIVGAIFQCGFIVIASEINSGHKRSIFLALRKGFMFLPFYLLASILMNIALIFGFILFVIPGIYLYLRLCLFDFFIIIEDKDPFRALQKSWQATKNNVFNNFKVIFPVIIMMAIFVIGGLQLNNLYYFPGFDLILNLIVWNIGSLLILVRYRIYILSKVVNT